MDWISEEQKARYLGFRSVSEMKRALGVSEYTFVSTDTITKSTLTETKSSVIKYKLDPWEEVTTFHPLRSPLKVRGCSSVFGVPVQKRPGNVSQWIVYLIQTPMMTGGPRFDFWIEHMEDILAAPFMGSRARRFAGSANTEEEAVSMIETKAYEMGWAW